MLTKSQVKEIREHLNAAQNPIFFFDNDPDGLCSFFLLQRFLGRGKGVPIKSYPDLIDEYFRKVSELNSDYIFILDKPIVSEKFFQEARKRNIPVVWIDHHLVEKELVPDFVHYYNPVFNKNKSDEPVTALSYQISGKKDDLWISVVGGISDKFVSENYDEFMEKYPDLVVKSKEPLDIYYRSQIGKVARILSFSLKDRTTNVVNMMRFMLNAKSPYEVLEESNKNHTMHDRYNKVELKYRRLLQKATLVEKEKEKILFFQYGGDLSISSDLSNELAYFFPEKLIVVLYINGLKANISMRGKKARDIFLEAIKDIEGARGGGHKEAVGGQISVEDIEKFRENLGRVLDSAVYRKV